MAKKKGVNKNRVNIDQMVAFKRAYGGTLGRRDYLKYVLLPGLGCLFFSTIVLYNPIISISATVIGMFYGWRVLMPKSIQKAYEQESMIQRNKFINNLTQILTDDTKTVNKALSMAKVRAKGEFKDDLTRLEAGLFGADISQIQDAMQEITDKYTDDVIFLQYMEQLETAAIEGRTNMDTLKDIKVYHNQMKTKQDLYEKKKLIHVGDMKTMMIFITMFIFMLTYPFGFSMYLTAFAHNWTGYVFGGLYLVVEWFFFNQFMNFLFDDSVVSMKK